MLPAATPYFNQFQIIAGVKEGEEEALMIAEGNWINGLATMEGQGGLNSKDEKKKI